MHACIRSHLAQDSCEHSLRSNSRVCTMAALPPAADKDSGPDCRASPAMPLQNKMAAGRFYAEYHGHPMQQLVEVVEALRQCSDGIVWLAGDSSLDNKHWLFDGPDKQACIEHGVASEGSDDLLAPATNGYEHVLEPQVMVRDVSYWINHLLVKAGTRMCCVNTAVEESTLADRRSALKSHDVMIRDCLKPSDVIVTSLGGNDVALRPDGITQQCIAQALMSEPGSSEYNHAVQHFVGMFKTQTEHFLQQLTAKTSPQIVVVCMLYYLDEKRGSGWCEGVLDMMGYNVLPSKLQNLISKVYEAATMQVQLLGIHVVPLPLFRVLDGKASADYCQRVEPSIVGGGKMAGLIVEAIMQARLESKH